MLLPQVFSTLVNEYPTLSVNQQAVLEAVNSVLDNQRKVNKATNQRLRRQTARSKKRSDDRKKIERTGRLYVHVCAWAKAIKIGHCLSAGSRRSLGRNTSTFWPNALVRSFSVELGVCTMAEARVRIMRIETLVRGCLQKQLLHKRREVSSE